MKILLRALLILGSIIVLIIVAVFAMRFYNTKKYEWTEETVDFHDYSKYSDSFDGGTIEHFESGMANGFHLMPDNPIDAEPVIVFGGSEGSSNFELAEQIATEGYEVYALFFFGADNQTETLNKVPLEFFKDFLDYANLVDEKVTILGGSKGAELGLVLTNYYEEINNLVLYSPSSYVFMGLDFSNNRGSSWTWKDEELSFIDITKSDFGAFIHSLVDAVVLSPVKYRKTYESAVEMADNKKEARIELSNFHGHMLLFAGGKDAMWQGNVAAKEIGDALGENAEVVIYEDAGHLFGAPPYANGLALGGTKDANKKAKEDSDKKLFEFLSKYVSDEK